MQSYHQQPIYSNPNGKRKLSPAFQPGPFDVLCARGKAAYEHEGNQRFRELVKLHKDAYASAPTKYHKSQIVSHITETVRQASPEGGFVKNFNGVWCEVGDRAAKEKIGQTFRDLLHNKYSSSTKAKARVRVQKRLEESQAEECPRPEKTQSLLERQKSDVPSSVSVVSNDEEPEEHRKPNQVPSHIEMNTKPNNDQHISGESLLESLSGVDFSEKIPAADLDPLPLKRMESSGMRGSFSDDLIDFCNVMGV